MYVVGIVAVQFAFGIDIIHHPEILQDRTDVQLLKFLQLVQSVGLFILPSFLIAYFLFYSVSDFLRFKKIDSVYIIILAIFSVLSFIPFSNLLSYLNNLIVFPSWLSGVENWMRTSEENANELTKLFLHADSLGGLLYNVLLIALIPALGEELLFRGVFQRLFTQWFKSIHWGIWISAILFSAIHFQFFGFIPRLFLGVLFGYLLELTGTIWLPIIAHFINNLTGVLMAYFISSEKVVNQVNESLGIAEWFFALLGGGVGFLCVWLIARKTNRIL